MAIVKVVRLKLTNPTVSGPVIALSANLSHLSLLHRVYNNCSIFVQEVSLTLINEWFASHVVVLLPLM